MNTGNGAYFGGGSGEYRYLLWRTWNTPLPRLLWVLLNPSTAGAATDDNTVACCTRFSKKWGYGGLEIVNLFALRSTTPTALSTHPDPIGPKNDEYIAAAAERAARIALASLPARIVVAWGEKGVLCHRGRTVCKLLEQHANVPLHCLGTTRDGSPRHPARLSSDTCLVSFSCAK